MVWYGTYWFGMVWHGMVWYGYHTMVTMVTILWYMVYGEQTVWYSAEHMIWCSLL